MVVPSAAGSSFSLGEYLAVSSLFLLPTFTCRWPPLAVCSKSSSLRLWLGSSWFSMVLAMWVEMEGGWLVALVMLVTLDMLDTLVPLVTLAML